MSEKNIRKQIENTINSISDDYKCVVYDNDLDLACTALYDFMSSYEHLFNDEISFYLNKARKLLSFQCQTIDDKDFDVFDTFSILLYKKEGVQNNE